MDAGIPATGWIAVPGSLLAWGQALPADRSGWGSDSLRWLEDLEPVAIIGNSVYVYYVSSLPAPSESLYRTRIKVAERAVRNDPSAENFFALAYVYQSARSLAKAIESYNEALRKDPRSAVAYNNLGSIFVELRAWDSAVRNLRKALEVDPQMERAKNNLAIAERRLKAGAESPP